MTDAPNKNLHALNIDDLADGEKPYLGDLTVVGDMIGAFMSDVIGDYARASAAGTLRRFPYDVQDRATELADVFLGREDGYALVAGWNCAGGIDAHVANAIGAPDGDPRDRLVSALVDAATDAVNAAHAADDGAADDDVRLMLDASKVWYAHLFTGIPIEPAPDPDADTDGAED